MKRRRGKDGKGRTGNVARIPSVLAPRIKQHHLPIPTPPIVLDVVNRERLLSRRADGNVSWSERASEGGLVLEVGDEGVFGHARFAEAHDLQRRRGVSTEAMVR